MSRPFSSFGIVKVTDDPDKVRTVVGPEARPCGLGSQWSNRKKLAANTGLGKLGWNGTKEIGNPVKKWSGGLATSLQAMGMIWKW